MNICSGKDYDAITPRMAEVLKGCARNRSETEIAQELGIEPSSVRSSLKNLRDIVGYRDKRDLGEWWVRRIETRVDPGRPTG